MKFTVPIQLRGSLNSREHWAQRAKRVKAERNAVRACAPRPGVWFDAYHAGAGPGWVVTLTRVAPRELDDDNLVGRLKGVRDEVAALIGVDDGDKRVAWRYQQRKGEPRQYAVEVQVEAAP